MVDVYTAPGCQPCRLTKRHLDKNHIPYTESDIDMIADEARARGISAAPVVVVDGKMWGGYRPDKIDALVA